MRRSAIVGLGVVSCALLAAACGGRVGKAISPNAATAHDAIGEAHVEACAKAVAGEPLVVDLKSSERSDLEVAMKDGVVVVGFDCKSLKIVKGCAAPGTYRFAGVTRKEDVVRMQSQDELAANLPLTGASLGASMKRGSTLDLALVTVGKKRSTATELVRTDLSGTCEGATHVVRGVYVGAFALATGTEGEVRAVAQIFGAGMAGGSAAGKRTEARDGDLEACRKSSADAQEAPKDCSAITRLELVPLVAQKAERDFSGPKHDDPMQVSCPATFVWDGVKCVKSGNAKAVKPCDRETGTKEECTSACDAGSADSCFNLAVYSSEELKVPQADGTTKSTRLPEPNPDVALLEKACSLGHASACARAASILGHKGFRGSSEAEKKAALEKSAKLYASACDLGDRWACTTMADFYNPNTAEQPTFAKSVDKLVAYTRRACDLGAGYACGKLGDMHRDGKGAKEDSKLAIGAYERQCSSGGYTDGDGCYKIGAIYANGKGVSADDAKAISYFERACGLHNIPACMAGVELASTAKDSAKARALLERGCTKEVRGWDTCLALGEAYEKGTLGLQKDLGKAADAYELGCGKGACARAGDLYKAGGPGLTASLDKALNAYTQGCNSWGEAKACGGQEAILKVKSKDELASFYEQRCEQKNDPRACLKLKSMGGTPKDETIKRYADAAQVACQRLHYGDECKLWKELGGKPTMAELAQPTREAVLKKAQTTIPAKSAPKR